MKATEIGAKPCGCGVWRKFLAIISRTCHVCKKRTWGMMERKAVDHAGSITATLVWYCYRCRGCSGVEHECAGETY